MDLVRVPSEATLRQALPQIDPVQLTAIVARLAVASSTNATPFPVGLAFDGKEVRGTGHHGVPCFLVGLVRHDGLILDQEAAASKLRDATATLSWSLRTPNRSPPRRVRISLPRSPG